MECSRNNHTFFKFMSDLIDSGIWSKLSSTARTLYPVLCRFSNESFTEIWPGTQKLLELTGFKNKKSLQDAKKELIKIGLIGIRKTGAGRESTRYFFRFDYKDSKVDIDLHRAEIIARRGVKEYPPEGYNFNPQGDKETLPNYINININQSEKYQDIEKSLEDLKKQQSGLEKSIISFISAKPDGGASKSEFINNLLNKYGKLEVGEAIKIAIQKDKKGDIRYLEGILRNRNDKILLKKEPSQNRINFNNNLNHWLEHISLKYKYKDIYYFTTYADLPVEEIKNDFLKYGFSIKIYRLKESKLG